MSHTFVIDEILEILMDGQPHNVLDIAKTINVEDRKVVVSLKFLREYEFVDLETNKDNNIMRVTAVPSLVEFLKSLRKP